MRKTTKRAIKLLLIISGIAAVLATVVGWAYGLATLGVLFLFGLWAVVYKEVGGDKPINNEPFWYKDSPQAQSSFLGDVANILGSDLTAAAQIEDITTSYKNHFTKKINGN